jgi:hypothetical protein
MRQSQLLVVWAISECSEDARQVDLLLIGKTALPSKNAVGMLDQILFTQKDSGFHKSYRRSTSWFRCHL